MSVDPAAAQTLGTVRIVGTGLLGASIGLGLRGLGVRVLLHDPSPTALALARDMGAGEPDPGDEPVSLVVVGAPPDVTAGVVRAELAAHPNATVTDVASVKGGIAAELAGADGIERYVGGHPMAGRERSGPTAARADLFLGRPWVVCPSSTDQVYERTEAVRMLAVALGATPVFMPAAEHDEAVALISHVPQLAASLVASRLVKASDPAVGLAGQGLRDVTRIADSDPMLWAQILSANAPQVAGVLKELRTDLDSVITALDALGAGEAVGARAAVAQIVHHGREGRERIPGKHGQPQTRYAVVTALLPDKPGQLARLFEDIGEAGINVEEFSLEHSPGARVGLGGVSVLPAAREELERALTERGWHVVA
ncbi:prephenate dehydrogenase [Kineosporia sp. NBRC 101731]|uniref:prephenate dehydrogenase n=1 Tax=Kineosporia sp. NBRC 101731 TaxID=3032199 RepID=UPI0024A18F37|nr:prephenate dehydrogenase [Kineosporia sp. NBRC 101731]GLY32408.1 prephenate dehydrogenase [Kineosporia sp. NBRC 101731]